MIDEKKIEQKIAERLLEKDRIGWKMLYSEYSAYLTGVCSRYISEKEDIKDILQNGFIKMFHNIEGFEFRGDGSLKAWMRTIVINEALKLLREKKKVDFKTVDFEGLEIAEENQEPDFNYISKSKIQELISELPLGYRTVFNLYVFEEKTHREIAEILEIGESSSASQFHRAKNILAKKIKDYKLFNARVV